MNIQSLSIVIPTGECWNHCKFCVSRQHCENYGKNIVSAQNIPQSYLNRISFVRDEDCNSMILTGTAEPQQNLPFIYALLDKNWQLRKPFYNISLQTTGTNLNPKEIKNLAIAGITTLALSISSLDDEHNWDIIGVPKKVRTMKLTELIACAKENGMNVRACLNLTDEFNSQKPGMLFIWAKDNNIDQVTFRKIYKSGNNVESKWIEEHQFEERKFSTIKDYVQLNGHPINRLPYGYIQFSVHGISVVIDDNCMAKENIEEMKYAILRPNGHLYSRWDDTGSLIF